MGDAVVAFDPSTARPVSSGFDPSTARPVEGLRADTSITSVAENFTEFASSRDPGIDYATGVKDAVLRAGFSRMSNDAEKSQYLDKFVGQGNWDKDSFGAYFIKPEGLGKLGLKSKVPVSLDEQTMSRYDIADLAGDAPAVLGGIGYGVAASGMGALPGMVMAALGAGGGKAIDEIIKMLQGHQVQTPGEVAGGIAKEGALAATGEGVTRALKPIGRFLFGPGASRMTPAKKELMEGAIEQGFKPRPGQVTDAPILARWEGMVKTIFGDLNKEANDAATEKAISALKPGSSVSASEAGDAVRSALVQGRRQLSGEARQRYGNIDAMVGAPFVPTATLKQTATEILESLPKTADGKPIFASGRTLELLQDITSLPDSVTAQSMQQIRTTLREASVLKNLTPDLSKAHARMLRQAADTTFDDAASAGGIQKTVIDKLRSADAFYKQEISKFDNKLVTAITRDPGKIGSIEPELVVDAIVKPGQASRIARIKTAVSPEAWGKVQAAHAEEITSSLIKQTDDPLQKIFDGKSFKEALDKYGADTLREVHGPDWTNSAYRLANSLMLVQKSMKASGAIVAANVALHPIANLPKLVSMRLMAKLIQQPGTLKYLTEGIRAPNTREGIEALTRVASQAAALAHDETGSAAFTVTNPKAPQE